MLSIAIGDRVRFGESLPHLGVRNGNRAAVMAVDLAEDGALRLRLRLDDGRVMEEPWQRLARPPRFGRKPSLPRLTHALAGTVYAAQARTVQAAVLAITAPTDSREIYVGLTRHRHAVRVVVERTRLDALCRQRQADPREPPSTSAILERLYKESRQYAEKTNVCDYAEDRVAFVETGRLTVSAGQDWLGFGRALQAAQTLRGVLARLYPECMIVPLRRILNQSRDHSWPDRIIERRQAPTLTDRIKDIIAPATQIEKRVQDAHHER